MIRVDDLYYSYPGSATPTIKGMSFSIEKGEIFGFLGPSGAGKSTTQKILIGILKGYRGLVEVMGRQMSGISADFYERVGMAFEFPNLYAKFTALENLRFFASLYSVPTERPEELLKTVGLEDAANVRVSDFSKGMKVRLNIARALLHRPELLFLDEPTSGLDPVNARMVRELVLKKREEGATVFLTTHNMQVAADICDRVGFIVDGTLRLVDSPRNLMVASGKRILRVEYHENGNLLSKEFPLRGIGNDGDFMDLLRGKEIETMHTLDATLEDVFIKATGRSLV